MPRFPIRLKLILGAVLLVTTLSVAFAWIADDMLRRFYQERTAQLRRDRVAEVEHRSVAVAGHIGITAVDALAGSETGRLLRLLKGIVLRDPEIRRAAIADDTGRVLVESDREVDATLARGDRVVLPPEGEIAVTESTAGQHLRVVTLPIRVGEHSAILGYLITAWSLDSLDRDLELIAARKERDQTQARDTILASGAVALLLGVLVGVAGGWAVSHPIRRLAAAARALSRGDLDARAAVHTRDEIGDLASTFNDMAGRIGHLVEEARTKGELEQQLEVARSIQRAMLPPPGLVESPSLHFAGLVESARDCGGDWWAHAALTRERTLVLIGDVTGHGISSALLAATAKSCLDSVRHLTQGDFRVGYFLKILDQLLREEIREELHMTCFASVVDPLEGTLTYANAGHNHPYLLRWTGDSWRHGRLHARGNRLGDADGYAFTEHTIRLRSRDLLCWYTDGLIEARAPDGRAFGSRRLRALLERDVKAAPDAILERILAEYRTFIGGGRPEDDVTCVVGRFLG